MSTRSRRIGKSASAPRTTRRLCKKCGVIHPPPTGKKCEHVVGSFEEVSNDNTNRTSTPIMAATQGTVNNVVSPVVSSQAQQPIPSASTVVTAPPPPASIDLAVSEKLDHLANAVFAINTRLGVIGTEVQDMKAKNSGSKAWDEVLNLSRVSGTQEPTVQPIANNVINNNIPTFVSPPLIISQGATSNPITSAELRGNPTLTEQAKITQQTLQAATSADPQQGTEGFYPNNLANVQYNSKHYDQLHSRFSRNDNPNHFGMPSVSNTNANVKSGRDRVGNPEHANIYVCWPQQCVFIGADRKRVRYEDLTHPQWTAGLTTMAAQESNPLIQKNMFSFIASLLQDVCDVGFTVGKGALALILVMMEESRLSWLDLTAIQEVRDKYCYRSIVAPNPAHSESSTSFSSTRNVKPNSAGGAQRRICKNFNSGSCTHAASHVTGKFLYEHFCSHCAVKGSKSPHSESRCRNRIPPTDNPL